MLLLFYIFVVGLLIQPKQEWIKSICIYWGFTWVFSFVYILESSSHQMIQFVLFDQLMMTKSLVFYGFILTLIGGVALLCIGQYVLHQQSRIYKVTHKRIATKGIYKHIRHPQYLGLMLLTVSMVLYHFSIGLILLWGGFMVSMLILINKEEQRLIKKYNEEFIMYQKQTKKIIPYIY